MPLQKHEEKWVDAAGIRTRYFDAGEGSLIILLHGGTMGDAWESASAEDWELNFSELAKTNRVIALDLLGQGYTDNPQRDEDWTISAAVAHVVAFLKVLALDPCHLVGHSRGGYVAARITADFPSLVASCTIVDSDTTAPGLGRDEFVFALNPHEAGSRESLLFIHEKYSHTTDHVTDAWVDTKLKVRASEKNREAIRKMMDQGLHIARFLPNLLDNREQLFVQIKSGLQRPVLVYWGYNDPTAPLQQGLRLYEMIALNQHRTQMHIVNGAGHHSFRERPAEFNRVIAEFVEGVCYGD
jgi:pimeloyl-ACP methyl ester carboxylesterase